LFETFYDKLVLLIATCGLSTPQLSCRPLGHKSKKIKELSMKTNIRKYLLIVLFLFSGCASFRTDVSGLYTSDVTFSTKSPVKVFFDLYHYEQSIGKDAIPKLLYRPGIDDFDDIFKESLKHLSNIKEYETFINRASDVDNPERRSKRDSIINRSDYSMKIEVFREKSYANHFLGAIVSTLTVTAIPIPYTWDYSVFVTVTNNHNQIVGKYKRSASVTTWYQLLLIFVHSFYVEEKKNEDIYLEMLSNIFTQIENENILK
jgi:hypothetical protein